MNCPKCDSPLREGAKFCTACGQKIDLAGTPTPPPAPASDVCPSCGAALRANAKFCTSCGERLSAGTDAPQPSSYAQETGTSSAPVVPADPQGKSVPDANVVAPDTTVVGGVGQRIYWNILPGQIARVITEVEFESLGAVQGIIVPEGMTAYIRANGRTIAALSGGAYDFVGAPEEVGEKEGIFKRGWKMLANLFRSEKAKEDAARDAAAASEYNRQQRLILENAKNGAAFSVVILLNKAFPLLVGARQANPDDYKTFVPMKIRTRHVELDVGVNAYFKIADAEQFILHYLTDRSLFNTTHVLDEISEPIRICVQNVLENCEPDEKGRVPDELRGAIKIAINAEAERGFHGIAVVRVAEITSSNEDLARFAELSREMYLSEKELDYLKRTNDFKNRLADVTNEQRLHEARSGVEMQRALDEINRDDLLREDELEKFKTTLENARIVREAKDDGERDAALAEIRNAGLIRETELEMLLSQKVSALKMMQYKDGLDFERVRMQGEQEIARIALEGELSLAAKRDEYADSRFYKELEKQKAADEQELERRRAEAALEREETAADVDQLLRVQNAEREHLLAVERERSRREMSAEQVLAEKGGAEAALEFARGKFGGAADRAANDRIVEMYQKNFEMMQNMMQRSMPGAPAAYPPNYGQPPMPPHAGMPNAAPRAAGTRFCGECGAENPAGTRFCGGCGAKLG